jgi:Ca-activated chloride channel family protein
MAQGVFQSFPVAHGASLLGMDAVIGEKRLKSIVLEKKEAEERYEKALDEGDTPILVQESSPGLYTANLGNIKDNESVSIEIHCAQLLRFEQGRIRVQIPTAIAPRYGDAHKTGGLAPHETDAVGFVEYPLTACIHILGETAKASVRSPSHEIRLVPEEAGITVLLESGAMLDRDFILLLDGRPGIPLPCPFLMRNSIRCSPAFARNCRRKPARSC